MVLQAALSNAAVCILLGADRVNGVNEPLSAGGNLKLRKNVQMFKKLRKEICRSVLHTVLQSMHMFCIWFPFLTIGCLHEKLTFFRLDFVVLLYRHCLLRNSMVVQTWNKAVESSLKPSEPGCRTRDMADGSSSASKALKATSPNTLA